MAITIFGLHISFKKKISHILIYNENEIHLILTPEVGGGVTVTSSNIPELVTCADTWNDLGLMVGDALSLINETRIDRAYNKMMVGTMLIATEEEKK